MRTALKEWAVVIEALASGRQHFLLRKGGIAEGKQGFEVNREFLLYPTWEHQQIESIRPKFHNLFEQAKPRSPGVIDFRYLAKVTDVLLAPTAIEAIGPLENEHIWRRPYIEMRYGYRSERPLFVVLVRAFRLAQATEIAEIRRYAGCRSWVELEQEIPAENAAPAQPDEDFEAARKSLLEKLLTGGESPALTPFPGAARPPTPSPTGRDLRTKH